ncbi:MAG: NUDIX hydrolase [Candidatus Marinimicrobia bacterium]|nr:NUDIX hydrolase [Candidatus Neomarinimicrobiota bacterium]
MKKEPQWLDFVKKFQSIAQAGLSYSKDPYDIERFEQILVLTAEMAAAMVPIPREKILGIFQKETGYLTPKIDVRAVIFLEKKLLLVKETIDGKWALPGGWADSHHSLRENLIKEAKEEAGALVEPRRIIAIHDRKKHNYPPIEFNVYKIFVLCDLIEYQFHQNIETSQAKFFGLHELPELSEGRNNSRQIRMCFEALTDNNVYFD